MARYKVLKSVAHNLAHSFASVMNYTGDDYFACHLLRGAIRTKSRTLTFDVRRRLVGPTELLNRGIVAACDGYAQDFGRLIAASGAALDMVDSVVLTARITPSEASQRAGRKTVTGRLDVAVRLVDDRGRAHLGRVSNDYTCRPLR